MNTIAYHAGLNKVETSLIEKGLKGGTIYFQ
jgi:hypothetical protein